MQYSCVGTFIHTIDKKNRVFIPSKIREVLGENFYTKDIMDIIRDYEP